MQLEGSMDSSWTHAAYGAVQVCSSCIPWGSAHLHQLSAGCPPYSCVSINQCVYVWMPVQAVTAALQSGSDDVQRIDDAPSFQVGHQLLRHSASLVCVA